MSTLTAHTNYQERGSTVNVMTSGETQRIASTINIRVSASRTTYHGY